MKSKKLRILLQQVENDNPKNEFALCELIVSQAVSGGANADCTNDGCSRGNNGLCTNEACSYGAANSQCTNNSCDTHR